MRIPHLLFFVAGVVPCALGQGGHLIAPVMGHVYDERLQAIRSIRGIPGAAILESAPDAGPALTGVAVSNEQRIALGYARDRLMLLRFDTGSVLPVAGASTDARRIAWSPSGQSAVLAGSEIQVLTGSPDAPVIQSIGGMAADPGGAVAVSDDGVALLSSGGGPASPVWLVSKGSLRQAPAPGSIVAAAFRAHSGDAAAITRSGDVYLIESADGDAVVRQVLAGDERTVNPVAVYFAADGRRILSANVSGTLSVLELATGSLTTVSCGCAPSALDHLSGEVFRVTGISEGPVWLLDTRAATPRVWFVPQDGASAARREGR